MTSSHARKKKAKFDFRMWMSHAHLMSEKESRKKPNKIE